MYINMKTCCHLNGGKPFKGVIHVGGHAAEEAEDYSNNGVERAAWFEANPKLMDGLKTNAEKFLKENYYYSACLSDIDGEKITFNVSNNGQSSSMLELGSHAQLYPHIHYVEKQEVVTKRMDKMIMDNFKELDIRKYDFVNLDVQGAELKVLKGFGELLATPWIKGIYTEVNFEHVYKNCALVSEIDSYLGQFGFKRILTAAPEIKWGDSLYLRLPK